MVEDVVKEPGRVSIKVARRTPITTPPDKIGSYYSCDSQSAIKLNTQ